MLQDAIDLALRLGVNPDYRHRGEKSFEHNMLSNQDQWFAQFRAVRALEGTLNDVMLQQGPARTSVAIASYGFAGAIELLQELPSPDETIDYPDNRVSGLTHLGQSLIKAAMHCLPDDIVELVPLWQDDLILLEDRIEIMEKLSAIFEAWYVQFIGLNDEWTLWNERLARVWPEEDMFTERQYGSHHVLPRMYGKADTSLLRPNCLGVSIMLAAWCELAGVKYWYCNTLQDRGTGLRQLRRDLYNTVINGCEVRGIEIPEQRQFEIFTDVVGLSGLGNSSKNFHHCVIVQLDPEHWMLVDPYLNTTGVISASEELGSVSSHLDELRLALPGAVFPTRLVDFHAVHSRFIGELNSVIAEATDFATIEQQLLKALEFGSGIFEPGHFSVEVGVPSYQIASMVLNHLAAWDREFSNLVDPYELATLTGSQLVWHDSIVGLDAKPGNDDELQELIGHLQQIPTDLLHVLNSAQIAIHTKERPNG